MNNNLNVLVRELAEIYDKDSQDTFVTLYTGRDTDGRFLKQREKACMSLLKGEEQKNFNDTMKEIRNLLKKNHDENIAVFASHKYNYFKTISLPIEVNNSLVVDSSPYIRPLARIIDEWESFTLVLLNSNFAKIYSVSLGEVEHEEDLSADIMNRHKKGGCSQARFQRLRKGAIHAFFIEVAEALEKIADMQIVLAGPGQAKIRFRDMLSKNLSSRIIQIIDISIEDEKELLKQSIQVVSEREEQKSHEAVQQLKMEILKDGLAVYGLEDTIDAVKNGQVELLLIEKDYKIRGWICEHCQIVKEGTAKTCLSCGRPVSEVDVLEEILEFAERTDAEIEFTDDEELSKLGHIGAILRYR